MRRFDPATCAETARRCDRGFAPTAEGSFELENIRLLDDGSAILRDGFAYRCTLPADVRAVLEGSGETSGCVYIVAGSSLYIADTADGSVEKLSDIPSSGGKCAMFRYGGKLHLLDGGELWQLDDNTLTAAAGYIPLYGRNWHPHSRGNVNEELNLLTRKIRIHYKINELTHSFEPGFKLSSVDYFEVNGVKITGEATPRWYLESSGLSIMTTGVGAEDSVVICATVAEDVIDRSSLTACTAATVVGDGGAARICCYDGTNGERFFISRPVPASDIDEARRADPASGELYFPVDGRITVGDGGAAVRAILPVGDDALLMSEGNIYAMKPGRDGAPALTPTDGGVGLSVSSHAASSAAGALAEFGGRILFVSPNGRATELGDLASRTLASEVRSAAPCRRFGEIWLSAPADPAGRVLVFNLTHKCVSTFTGVYADRLFPLGDTVGFLRGRDLYTFDSELSYDQTHAAADTASTGTTSGSAASVSAASNADSSGGASSGGTSTLSASTTLSPIAGLLTSPFFDLGKPRTAKRLNYCLPDIHDGAADIILESDSGYIDSARVMADICHDLSPARPLPPPAVCPSIGVFDAMRYRICISDISRPRIVGMTVSVRR